MPYAVTDDSTKLYFEESGSGIPVLFVHEFAGDYKSWEPQVREFSRRYRCITYNARGYPPSDVPEEAAAYSQARAVEDMRCVLDHLGIDRAHVVGLSMAGSPRCTSGSPIPTGPDPFSLPAAATAPNATGMTGFAQRRLQLHRRSGGKAWRHSPGDMRLDRRAFSSRTRTPRGWQEFANQLAEHSAEGSALTQLGVQRERPSIFDLG